MAVLTGPVYVSNPTPSILRYGLFTVANGPFDLPSHGGDGGLQYLSNSCVDWDSYEVNCLPDLATKGPYTESLTATTIRPFVVVSGFTCGPVGVTPQERQRLMFEKLKASEQNAVEEIFSSGAADASPSLSNNVPAATDVGPSFGLVEAFSVLESNFYTTYGYQGTIHLPFAAAAYAANERIMEFQNRIWRTALGTTVSIGHYWGRGPAGEVPSAGNVWIYITPPVTVWRTPDSNVFISPLEGALDRSSNQVSMLAEREYAIGFDACRVYATQTLLTEGS